ncbi:heterodimeric methylmalonyl-CoA mutase small subunit [Jatrophihabitans endophyticus]|uniref:Heterodimeric methylmalonyl-CoA mutase small subunit n=1 Tax=Jatrophihabitans endophyticus TaxID=1206085 RepID=A0A1M5G7H3_9ACTN|nr:methylmalonyl-CoA mutase subunit beta [Jatrophihabitans endophyticus]SHF99638.1 heterodimeric methylmalonyl-CoA mutase small subunit [Jatrophihabitans endophyticus]
MPDEPADPQPPRALALAADFPTPTRDDWRALVAAVLAKSGAGADVDPEAALTSTTYDGIAIKPLYTADDLPAGDAAGLPGRPPFVRGATTADATAAGWDVRTRHAGSAQPDADRTNAAVLNDLETGATSVWLVLGAQGIAVDDLPAVLADVYLDLAPVVLDAGADTVAAASALLALAERRGVAAADLRGSFGADPIGLRARTGADAELGMLRTLAEQGGAAAGMCLATVDGTVYHDAGASDAQEIGIATAVGVAYLRALTEAGLDVDAALAALEFRLAVTAEQFPAIAKLRAARRVWDRVAELCGASAERRGQRQHAVTSAAMLTRRDPWVNLLRTTIGCFAAAVGGADAVTVLPFDHALGAPDDFGRRIARNTQSVLHDESSLARVVDPAGGSWFVESLTDQLAEAAWAVFAGIERAGGALAALDDGTVEGLLADTRAGRDDDIAHRRAPITGVSEFAHVDEAPVERTPWPPAAGGPLPPRRYAEPFEALRDRADAQAERPAVFLATLGPPAVHSARAGFAANLFQAGGLACVTGPVEEFADAGTTVACLCSSDKTYADEAEVAAKALRDAGATQVWLAGKGEYEGVDDTLFAGCDALAVLRRTHDELGVS